MNYRMSAGSQTRGGGAAIMARGPPHLPPLRVNKKSRRAFQIHPGSVRRLPRRELEIL